MHKVMYREKEGDIVSTRLQKRHIYDFTRYVEKIENEAEDIIDRLNIYIIKGET